MNVLKKDITTVEIGIIIHGVNCLGVMGAGVALAIKKKWPLVYTLYKIKCKEFERDKSFLLGQVQSIKINDHLYVNNCFTQLGVASVSNKKVADINAVDECLNMCFQISFDKKEPLYSPMIGCGLGGLSWQDEVKPLFLKYEEKYGVVANICMV